MVVSDRRDVHPRLRPEPVFLPPEPSKKGRGLNVNKKNLNGFYINEKENDISNINSTTGASS
jgi:hypothetical protein